MAAVTSSHLEWRVGLSDTILKGAHPGTIYAKFGSIWPSCFRGEDFFNISQSVVVSLSLFFFIYGKDFCVITHAMLLIVAAIIANTG
jgi:hypothetical protein